MATKKASTKRAKIVSTKTPTKVVKTSSVKTRSANASVGQASLTDRMMNAPIAALFAEGIGTFLFAVMVSLTASSTNTGGQPIFMLFAVAAIVLIVGHLSGAHINPAITFGAWVTRKITTLRAIGYILFQVFGAMLAFVVLSYLVQGSPAQMNPATGEPLAAKVFQATQVVQGKEWITFFASMIGMTVFGFAFASALRERKEHFAAAFTVGGGFFIALVLAGAAAILNPAVALTVQSFTSAKGGLLGGEALGWALTIQLAAPLVGSAVGFFLYDLFRRDADTTSI